MISGAQALVKCLEQEGVRTVFGYPGATIAPFYDCLGTSEIRHVLTRGEQSAGHAASGYARMTGKPAVCVCTSGPGATNLFTALATAYSDSIPLVAITGQVSTELLGRDVFQEVDATGATESFTKYSYLVKRAADIPRVFREAFYIASTGRKGPVLIDMPVDVQRQLLEFTYPETVDIRGYKPRFKGHIIQVRRVAEALRAAKRPLLCAGGGVLAAGASAEVRALCESCSIPVVSTMMGIGVLPPDHPLYYGMLGQSGTYAANSAVRESDLLVIIGARVGDRAVTAPEQLEGSATIVHIDIDAAEIGKNLGATIPLVGDAAQVVRQLNQENPCGEWRKWVGWLDSVRCGVGITIDPPDPPSETYVTPDRFVRELGGRMRPRSVYVSDVGLNQIWSAKNFSVQEGRFMTTGGMGTMGYSLPAAIGAKAARPDKQVVAVCGDGAFQMALGELATAVQHGIPVKLVVMHNGCLGMVRQIQDRQYRGRQVAVSLDGSPDIGLIAQAYGIPFERVCRDCEAPGAIDRLLEGEGSFVLECMVDPKEEAL